MISDNLLTVALALVIVTSFALAGTGQRGPRVSERKLVTGEEVIAPSQTNGAGQPVIFNAGPGAIIDSTTYDYGSNGSALRNLVINGSTVSLGRMMAHDLTAGTLTRGSYFQCSTNGGTTWPTPSTQVETVRRGWTSIFNLGGKAGTVSHTGLDVNTDAALCSRTWTSHITGGTGQLWPRIAISGTRMHIIYGDANPPTNVLYARSTNGGTTFDMIDVPFAAPAKWVADADAYDIATSGSKIAVAIGGAFGSIELVQSTNNGATWSQSTIYDIDTTFFTEQDIPDGSCQVAYDNSGNVHVVWSTYYGSGNGPDSVFYSINAGIYHWSAATGVQEIALPPADVFANGFVVWRDGAVATGPDIAIDASDVICVIYSSFIKELDASLNNHEHVFGVASGDGGATWEDPIDLTPGSGFDATFPSVADLADGDGVHIVYNCDPFAGNFIQATPGHPQIWVKVMYLEVPKDNFFPFTGITCEDMTSFVARCIGAGTKSIQARVRASGGWPGQMITISVDGTPHTVTAQVKPDNSASQWKLQVSGVGTGTHTVTLKDPAGCFSPIVVDCGVDQPSDEEWNDDASWGTDLDATVAPTTTKILGNYPNPFNPSTTIRYLLAEETNVSVKIFNMLGQEVATLVNGVQKAGEQSIVWHATNNFGQAVSSGLYIYRIQAGNLVLTEKMILLH